MENEDIVIGRNPVAEIIKAGKRTIEKILVTDRETKGSISQILGMAKEKRIKIEYTKKEKLDKLSQGENHQGIVAITSPYEYKSLEDIFKSAEERNEDPFILILDGLEDVHNFGAIIRTAESAGVHGIIIPKRNSVYVNSTVYKTSSGAVEYVNIVKVTNIAETIVALKEKGVWVYGIDMSGENYYNTNLTGPVALVTGSEGKGIRKLVKERCDGNLKIPMKGKVSSLNASVATSIVVYEVVKQRIQ